MDDVSKVLFVAFRKVQHGLGISRWRSHEPLPVRIFADAVQDGADPAFN